MGTKVPKTVGEYGAFDLDLGVVCGTCGRVAVFQGFEVEAFFKARGVRTSLPVDTRLFTCRCGSKKVTTIGVPIDKRPGPYALLGQRLAPLYVLNPGMKR
jgi:hypothetical protein